MMSAATFSITIVRDIVQYVTAQGVTADRLYEAAQIHPDWLEDPDRQVSGSVLKELWRESIAQTGDPHLGLHIGEAFDLSAIGIVGYVLLNCKTYGQVLTKLSQYTSLFSRGITLQHRVAEGWGQCDCEVIETLENYLREEPRHPLESTFAALFTATQQLTGKPLDAQAVWFQHPQPKDWAEHERIFQTRVAFAQPVNRIIFAPACLEWPVRSANLNLLSVFEAHALTMLQSQSQTYRQKVIAAIEPQFQGEVPGIETIARTLMVSVRQLQRELQLENTSYQQLLDETRKAVALSQLKQPTASIHDVAFLLGFSEPSAFHRAFKRWTGETPRRYRLNQAPPKDTLVSRQGA